MHSEMMRLGPLSLAAECRSRRLDGAMFGVTGLLEHDVERRGDVSEARKGVDCREHGIRDPTFVCRHLASGVGSGFHRGHDDDDPDRLWPDAWCDACERVRQSEGEWNDRSEAFAGVQLLCDGCYQAIRERNWTQDDEAFRQLLSDAAAYLRARQEQLGSRYNLAGYARYHWRPETGQLIFSDDGRARVVADVQFVGSVSTRNNTWLWSWANQSILESVRQRVREVRAYGDAHGYLKLAAACWSARQADGWEMSAITAYLIGAAGAHRSSDDRGSSFVVLTDVHWAG